MGSNSLRYQTNVLLGPGYASTAAYKSLPLEYQLSLKNEFARLYPEAMQFLDKIQFNAFTAPIYIIGTLFASYKLYELAKKWYNFIRSKRSEIEQVAAQNTNNTNQQPIQPQQSLDQYNVTNTNSIPISINKEVDPVNV